MLFLFLIFISSVTNAFKIPVHSFRFNKDRSLAMNEIVHNMTPEFFFQLTGCSSLVFFGSVINVHHEEHVNDESHSKFDIFRDSPLRYAGYFNEVGEAFRPLIPSWIVAISYIIALSYILADATSKGAEYHELNKVKSNSHEFLNSGGFIGFLDTLCFQLLASILFPGFIINRWVAFIGFLTFEQFKLPNILDSIDVQDIDIETLIKISPENIACFLPTIMGLVLIPFIVQPLDDLAEFVLYKTTRTLYIKQNHECFFYPFKKSLVSNHKPYSTETRKAVSMAWQDNKSAIDVVFFDGLTSLG